MLKNRGVNKSGNREWVDPNLMEVKGQWKLIKFILEETIVEMYNVCNASAPTNQFDKQFEYTIVYVADQQLALKISYFALYAHSIL